MIEVGLGVLVGVVTGLVPGLHLNTFIPVLASLRGLVGFVVGVVIAHSFFDFFPAVFLGVPDQSTSLSVLPAHKMVLQGKALHAFQLSLLGGVFCSLIAVLFLPCVFLFSRIDWKPVVLVFLLLMAFLMIFSARKKLLTLAVFVLAGVLGMNCLTRPHALLALFTGFFGASTLLYSLLNPPRIPSQKTAPASLPRGKSLFFGFLAGCFSGLMPAISSSLSGLLVKKLGRIREEGFLVVLGGANTVYAFMALFAIHLIGHPRSGAGLLIREESRFFLLLGSVLLAVGLSALLAWKLSSRVVGLFNRFPLKWLNVFSLLFLVVLSLWFNIFFLFLVSTSLGFICINSGVRRNTCMASLLLPTLLYYLP